MSIKSMRMCFAASDEATYVHRPSAFSLHWWNYSTPILCAEGEMMMYLLIIQTLLHIGYCALSFIDQPDIFTASP